MFMPFNAEFLKSFSFKEIIWMPRMQEILFTLWCLVYICMNIFLVPNKLLSLSFMIRWVCEMVFTMKACSTKSRNKRPLTVLIAIAIFSSKRLYQLEARLHASRASTFVVINNMEPWNNIVQLNYRIPCTFICITIEPISHFKNEWRTGN